jgi:hypothetical protein
MIRAANEDVAFAGLYSVRELALSGGLRSAIQIVG